MVVAPRRGNGILRRALASVARAAPARVFVVEGLLPPAPTALLRLQPGVEVVDSPRSATILLVAGAVPAALLEAIRRVHDEMAPPRRTVLWRDGDALHGPGYAEQPEGVAITGGVAEISAQLARLQAELVAGVAASEPAFLPDVEPAEWRGVGSFGQGGVGMTGGVPYGRPMAETASDRDGLRLDRLNLRIGPFFPPFPPGLVLTFGLQGDIIQEVSVGANPFVPAQASRDDHPFRQALWRPVPVATLELARARHHLRWLATTLRVHGLPALGMRALALAERVRPGDTAPIAELRALLERSRALALGTDGVGVVRPESLGAGGLGPVARASGLPDDARLEDERYRALGFESLTQRRGDARSRWRQRLAEAEQSVTLAERAGETLAGGGGRVESPNGLLTPTTAPLDGLLALLPTLLGGMEWGDAITTIQSFDLDLRALAPLAAGGEAKERA